MRVDENMKLYHTPCSKQTWLSRSATRPDWQRSSPWGCSPRYRFYRSRCGTDLPYQGLKTNQLQRFGILLIEHTHDEAVVVVVYVGQSERRFVRGSIGGYRRTSQRRIIGRWTSGRTAAGSASGSSAGLDCCHNAWEEGSKMKRNDTFKSKWRGTKCFK